MSVAGVRRRFINLLAEGRGVVTEAAYRGLVDYARTRGVTPGERLALLSPADYLRRSLILRDHGVHLDDVKLEPGAWVIAEGLGREFSISDLFAGLPNARPATTTRPPAPAGDSAALRAALDKGKKLGGFASWKVQTSGATLTFSTKAGGDTFPALVLDAPEWKDPAPRDVAKENAGALGRVKDLASLRACINEIVVKNKAYFEAEGVTVKGANERFGLQDLRRHTFFEGARAHLSGLDAAEREAALSALLPEKESLLVGREYKMQTGSHENYWPYWKNYIGFLHKVLAQTATGTDAYFTIKNRIEDIWNRKSVFGWSREVDERDFEVSINAAVVHRTSYSTGPGQRVSLAAASRPSQPVYEVLMVKSSGLPEALKAHAGAPVVRGHDGALTFDWEGPSKPSRAGQPVPDGLKAHLEAHDVEAGELGLRPFVEHEKPRPGVAFDWSHDGGIDVAPIEIGWWGHCHNEAPLNAMGIDPRREVKLYRAERGIPVEAATQTYSAEDIWDVAGALAADHEDGWAIPGGYRMRQTQVESVAFVGSRNNGGHWLLIAPSSGGRRIRVDAEVIELWHKSDPSKKYDNPMERFRRDLPAEDGAFAPNPEWVEAEARDADDITIDAKGRKLTVKVTFITVGDNGQRVQKKENVTLDPAVDKAVKLAEELSDYDDRHAKVVEHWYNPKTAAYYNVIQEVEGGRKKEISRTPAAPVAQVLASQETTYDSVIEIHEFVTKNMGLPFVFDTSSGMAVWNYPVDLIRIDREKEIAKDGFSYTTYKLAYETMGGPSNTSRYIIKRDGRGNAERALALDPMPDFAFREEHWVCAPAAADATGKLAVNVQALQAGYLLNKAGDEIVPELWRRQAALLYAGLSDEAVAGDGKVYVFETGDGALIAFKDAASFESAVETDAGLR